MKQYLEKMANNQKFKERIQMVQINANREINLNQLRLLFIVHIDGQLIAPVASDIIFHGSHDIVLQKFNNLECDVQGGEEKIIIIKKIPSEKNKKFYVRFYENDFYKDPTKWYCETECESFYDVSKSLIKSFLIFSK
jgi:hypothetical protein